MSNSLVVRNDMTLADLGTVLAKSGFFQDSRDAAQAVVKVLAGQELGFGPVASMTGINIIKGRVAISANLIAAAIKRSGRYNYKVLRLDDTVCEIEFYEGGKPVGVSTFGKEDADRAGAINDNYKKYPRNMYFSRAISNGGKWFCADVFGGPIYTPDELGAQVDGETGEVVEMPTESRAPIIMNVNPETAAALAASASRQQSQPTSKSSRPLEAAAIFKRLHEKAADDAGEVASEKQVGLLAGKLEECFAPDDDATAKRRAVVKYLWGVDSSKYLTSAKASATLDWLLKGAQDATGDYPLHPAASEEARRVYREAMLAAGQIDMFGNSTEQPAPNDYAE